MPQKKDWKNALQTHQTLAERYTKFVQSEPAVTVLPYFSYTPIVEYPYLTQAQRLNHLSLLTMADDHQAQQAMDSALADLKCLRLQLAQENTLIGKLIFNHMVVSQLQAIVLLKQRYHAKAEPIAFLSEQEGSLALPFAQEFEGQVVVLQQQNLSQQKGYDHADTVSAFADYMQKQINLSKMPIEQWLKTQNETDINDGIKTDKEKNPLGTQLIHIATPAFQVYTQRMWQVDNMINATNHILSDGKIPLKNVMDSTATAIDKNAEKICMTMPSMKYAESKAPSKSCVYL
ncbi:hypothetical protein [Acinetobacter sp. c3-l95]|uniref:hypothetical protein n=1 Tax=Acinetobacter sp. c3-l95 TaxID=3342804 RepID=UPI0035BA1C6F